LSPDLNAGENWMRTRVGDERVARLNVASTFVANEAAKAIRGAGSVSKEEEAAIQKLVNGNLSPAAERSTANEILNFTNVRRQNLLAKRDNFIRSYTEGPDSFQATTGETDKALTENGVTPPKAPKHPGAVYPGQTAPSPAGPPPASQAKVDPNREKLRSRATEIMNTGVPMDQAILQAKQELGL
jgi:hypothetical protein